MASGFGYGVSPDKSLQWSNASGTSSASLQSQPAGGSGGGGSDWQGILTQSLGGIGTIVDMFLKINEARSAEKARKRMAQSQPIQQSNMQIPLLGK